jgi:hypothetical protein
MSHPLGWSSLANPNLKLAPPPSTTTAISQLDLVEFCLFYLFLYFIPTKSVGQRMRVLRRKMMSDELGRWLGMSRTHAIMRSTTGYGVDGQHNLFRVSYATGREA